MSLLTYGAYLFTGVNWTHTENLTENRHWMNAPLDCAQWNQICIALCPRWFELIIYKNFFRASWRGGTYSTLLSHRNCDRVGWTETDNQMSVCWQVSEPPRNTRSQWQLFCRFSNSFLLLKLWSSLNSLKFALWGANDNNIGWDNGFARNKRQTIIWFRTDNNLVCWHTQIYIYIYIYIYASLCLDELI